ncbi:hypothetical protein J3459_018217 [Metarhizium acridum]|uniref:uncharacterized protein n=1 Tax=Metarhizium acridum TaxID=92637 RepID=UPI001C6AE4D7|nr:hypothetical protein J3459_018217 [Metarhizium acridum]KAG8411730.1 hypothetical protein J3458_015316 [Metarhizium acridum]
MAARKQPWCSEIYFASGMSHIGRRRVAGVILSADDVRIAEEIAPFRWHQPPRPCRWYRSQVRRGTMRSHQARVTRAAKSPRKQGLVPVAGAGYKPFTLSLESCLGSADVLRSRLDACIGQSVTAGKRGKGLFGVLQGRAGSMRFVSLLIDSGCTPYERHNSMPTSRTLLVFTFH